MLQQIGLPNAHYLVQFIAPETSAMHGKQSLPSRKVLPDWVARKQGEQSKTVDCSPQVFFLGVVVVPKALLFKGLLVLWIA